jgi:hypothetical protein
VDIESLLRSLNAHDVEDLRVLRRLRGDRE